MGNFNMEMCIFHIKMCCGERKNFFEKKNVMIG